MIAAAEPRINYTKLNRSLSAAKSDKQLYQKIVNAPFEQPAEMALLFLGFITFYLVDKAAQLVKFMAASDTEYYRLSVSGYDFEGSDYRLSLENDTGNDIVKAILTGQPQSSTDWQGLSRRGADLQQVDINQANSGIAYNTVFPLSNQRGAVLFCYFQYQENIDEQQHHFMERYGRLVSQFVTG